MTDPGKTAEELSDTTTAWITEVITQELVDALDDSNDTQEEE